MNQIKLQVLLTILAVISISALLKTIGFIITISGWSFFAALSYFCYKENEFLNAWLISTTVTMGVLIVYNLTLGILDSWHLLPFVAGLGIVFQRKAINLRVALLCNSIFLLWGNLPVYSPFNLLLTITFGISELILLVLLILKFQRGRRLG